MASQPADERLKLLQRLTDSTLSKLAEQDLLDELLSRVKKGLNADVCAVFLMNGRSHSLVAAANGLDGDLGHGSGIAVGEGFVGRVAAERKPVMLNRVDATTACDPGLLAAGVRALLGVPLVSGGRVLGVLHVGTRSDRAFSPADAEVLQVAADRAAAAVQSLLARDDRRAAEALQRSLLPAAPPRLPGVEMAARYLPGTGVVGGDWYDVFALPSGEIGLVIGDVAGSGLPAAVVMGRMRSTLRSYALQTSDPAEVLRRLDRKIQYFEAGSLATVLYAVVGRERDVARVSSAGHLPPVYAPPGGPAVLVPAENDLLIGLDVAARRRTTTIGLTPGSVLCCYTDGLVERRGEVIDHGIERLRSSVVACPAETLTESVMRVLADEQPRRDDTALLMIRMLGPASS
jgi:phosphoserine phosphatase RsbU/P